MLYQSIRVLSAFFMLLICCFGCISTSAEQPTSVPTTVNSTVIEEPSATPTQVNAETGPANLWLNLGNPEQTIVHIIAAQDFDVFVETDNGSLLSCKTYKAANGEFCWQPISTLPPLNTWIEQDCYEANDAPVQQFPSEVKQMLVVTDSAEDVFVQNCFALLEDNTVWKSNCGSGNFDQYPPTIAPERRVGTTEECIHVSP